MSILRSRTAEEPNRTELLKMPLTKGQYDSGVEGRLANPWVPHFGQQTSHIKPLLVDKPYLTICKSNTSSIHCN